MARRWLDCLHESERLRLELHRVPVPDGLSERLLAAACLLLLLGLAGGLLLQERAELHKRLVSIGILAINTHINDRRVSVQGSDPGDVARRLSPEVPYPVTLPRDVGGLRLRGGRRASLGACPAVYTLWTGPRGDTSIIQIRVADFALGALPRQEVDVRSEAFDPHPCHVTIWSEGAMGYLLVTDTHS